jgi:hypothetical protein
MQSYDLISMLKSAVDQALPYLVFLAAFVIALKWLEAKFTLKRRGRRWRADHRGWHSQEKVLPFQPRHDALPHRALDAADQLRTVMRAEFKAQPLLNKSETRLFRVLDKMVIEMAPPGWQVMAQVSLGEILRCEDKAAFGCINSKRVDLLIVDADCNPLHAIEYQGGGHFKGAHATAARDAVKKEALRRAGIGYDEVVAGNHTPAELRRVVEKLVGKTATAGAQR